MDNINILNEMKVELVLFLAVKFNMTKYSCEATLKRSSKAHLPFCQISENIYTNFSKKNEDDYIFELDQQYTSQYKKIIHKNSKD